MPFHWHLGSPSSLSERMPKKLLHKLFYIVAARSNMSQLVVINTSHSVKNQNISGGFSASNYQKLVSGMFEKIK